MLFCVQIHGSAGWISWPARDWREATTPPSLWNGPEWICDRCVALICAGYCPRAIFRAIYRSATAQVRVQPPGGGGPIKTKPFDVNRGVVQGDIFSPVCFIVALECLMRKADAGGGVTMLQVFLSKLEYDAALINCNRIRARKHRRESRG